jgi:MraZ protein
MLIGEYRHTVDDKRRVSLPAKFREEISDDVVITRGLDSCLFVYPHDEWEEISKQLSQMSIGQSDSRGFNRFILSGAQEISIDSAGRILIPEYLQDFAEIKEQVVLAGVNNRIEIWDESQWDTYRDRIEEDADDLAEKLGEFGML